jgi:hypothetical protein
MQYMITWNERQQGSPIEYENAQKRILEVFRVCVRTRSDGVPRWTEK